MSQADVETRDAAAPPRSVSPSPTPPGHPGTRAAVRALQAAVAVALVVTGVTFVAAGIFAFIPAGLLVLLYIALLVAIRMERRTEGSWAVEQTLEDGLPPLPLHLDAEAHPARTARERTGLKFALGLLLLLTLVAGVSAAILEGGRAIWGLGLLLLFYMLFLSLPVWAATLHDIEEPPWETGEQVEDEKVVEG